MATKRTSVISSSARSSSAREVSEFDGIYLNIGVNVKDAETGEENFVRLKYGVAVSSLVPKKIYARQLEENPEYAAQLQIENQIIAEIQAASRNLEEGEGKDAPVLSVQLYRASTDVAPEEIEETAPTLNLFG